MFLIVLDQKDRFLRNVFVGKREILLREIAGLKGEM